MQRAMTLFSFLILGCSSHPSTPRAPAAPPTTASSATSIAGEWNGALEVPGQTLAISIRFDDHGGGTISIPEQGAKDLPLSKLEVKERGVHFELTAAGAVFDGTRTDETISGTLHQGGMEMKFTISRARAAQQEAAPPVSAAAGAPLVGTWRGVARDGDAARRIELVFARDRDVLSGSGSVGGSCAAPPPIAGLRFSPPRAQIELAGGLGGIDATLDHDALVGTLSIGGRSQPLRLERVPATRPTAAPYRETEVAISSAPGVRLAGTLTIPEGASRPPVVVLVTGSGPQDRDECVAGVRAFRELADHLARNGIATLRYDDRGTAHSTGDFAAATPPDLVADAAAAVQFLRAREDIDPRRIGVLGHSEGGLIAAMIAARDPQIAFAVLWATPGLRLPEVGIAQTADMMRAEGAPADVVERLRKAERIVMTAFAAATSADDFGARIREGVQRGLSAEDRRELGDLDAWIAGKVRENWTAWMRWYLSYDPQRTLASVKCPVLAVNGSLDMQVEARTNLAAIQSALAGARHPDFQIVELPKLDHLLQVTRTGAPSHYGRETSAIDSSVLETTATWIHARALKAPAQAARGRGTPRT